MIINKEYIKKFNPCDNRFYNYVDSYQDQDFSIIEFLRLDKITYDDKIWVWKRLATINEAALFGLKCVESILYIYEEKYPTDNRPRLALKSIKRYMVNPNAANANAAANAATNATNYYAANAANAYYANAANANAAYYAANANAAYYAANAANAAYYAANAATNATNYYAANAAAYYAAEAAEAVVNAAANAAYYANAAANATIGKQTQQDKNLQFLIEIYEGR
jgi:hypothetical protein